MKLKLEFGLSDGVEIVSWFRDILDFPRHIRYQGAVYEFVMYDRDKTSQQDYILHFSQTRHYLAKWEEIPTFTEMFGLSYGNVCQCGAKFDRHFPNIHMFMCPKWKPLGSKK